MSRKTFAWWLVLALMGAGCVPKRIGQEVVWPATPETPRIKFVTAFQSTAELDLSASAALVRGLVGGGRDVSVIRPMGLALSNDGKRLYIADHLLEAVLVADFEAKKLVEFAPSHLVGLPFGVAVDAQDNVYVADQTGKKISVFDKAGALLRVFGTKEGLIRPSGLAIDQKRGLLYVSDPASVSSQDHRVLVFTTEGKLVRTVGKGRGAEDGEFNFPIFLTVDAQGRLFVADTMNFRVQVFDPDGNFLTKYGEHGNGPGTFARTKGLAHDRFGNLYVVEGEYGVVQIFNPDFAPLMFFGGRAPLLEYLDMPSGIAIDPVSNRIYVANDLNPRINVYELINTDGTDSKPAN